MVGEHSHTLWSNGGRAQANIVESASDSGHLVAQRRHCFTAESYEKLNFYFFTKESIVKYLVTCPSTTYLYFYRLYGVF